jgi:hypothetical protein
MFYVYEIKLHIFQSLSHSIIFLSEKVSIENYYCCCLLSLHYVSLLGKSRGKFNNNYLCNEFLCKLGFLGPRGQLEKPNLHRNELHTKFYCLKRRP